LKGEALSTKIKDYKGDFYFKAELYVDGIKTETSSLPVWYTTRKLELFWKYQLPKGEHTVKVKLLNPTADFELRMSDILVYDSKLK